MCLEGPKVYVDIKKTMKIILIGSDSTENDTKIESIFQQNKTVTKNCNFRHAYIDSENYRVTFQMGCYLT